MDIQVVTNPADVAALIDPTGGDAQFSKTMAEIEADKKKKAEDALMLEQLREKSKPKPTPIKLEYKYSGTCKTCSTPVKTLVADMGKIIVFAFCDKCNIQLKSIEVQPIIQTVEEIKEEPIATPVIIKKEKKK